jgi:tRNA threonylcarbamoyl adenosine modification protein YeaZ
VERRALLALDTATSRTALVLRRRPGAPIDDGSSPGPERGAASLGTQLVETLTAAGVSPRDLAAVGAGTGPGGFTGLRVGIATAKTLAWSLRIPLVGIPSSEALLRAASAATGADPGSVAVLQPAGARDHYLSLPDAAPRLVTPTEDLPATLAPHALIAPDVDPLRVVGCQGPGGLHPVAAGMLAIAGLGAALLTMLEERLAADLIDDVASLVPVYVALPRGVAAASGAAWAPDLR